LTIISGGLSFRLGTNLSELIEGIN
jgi:hypothetical protein